MKNIIKHIRDAAILLILSFASCGIVARVAALEFIDQRYQQLLHFPVLTNHWVGGFTGIFLILAIFYILFRKSGISEAGVELLKSSWPLLLWIPGWFFQLEYAFLPWYIFTGAYVIGNCAGKIRSTEEFPWKKAFTILSVLCILFGAAGGAMQIWSYDLLAMQWFDWGHFYESLTNTLDGRFFYLDLEKGCFLGSRFCISLLILLPVAALRSPELFLLSGALLVASGGILVMSGARKLKCSALESFLCGVLFLCLPVTLNLLLVLLDGFHESFLLIPSVLGAWCCYRGGRKKWAALLWIFSLGVRETAGFMWMMWGIMLLFKREKRRDGIILFLGSACWTFLLLLVVMPWISSRGGGYIHTVFFPHLGSNILEIALSPFTHPDVFFGTLFSVHNMNFWIVLLLPFIFSLATVPWILVAMLPDLLMVSLDYRFDSQNLMRHYQIVPLLVLTIAFVEGLGRLKSEPGCWAGRMIGKIFRNGNFSGNYIGYSLGCGILLSCCFVQIPYFPAGDPRLPSWSRADELKKELFERIRPGEKITAGPRLASFFAGRNDLNVYRSDMKHDAFDRIVIEGFNPMYGENALRIKLLKSDVWDLKYTYFLDERLIQLFEKRKSRRTTALPCPPSVMKTDDKTWMNWGVEIPCRLQNVDIRGRQIADRLFIGVRLNERTETDFGIRVTLEYADGAGKEIFFNSFGDGIYPACFAEKGTLWITSIPLNGIPKICQVDQIVLTMETGKIFK